MGFCHAHCAVVLGYCLTQMPHWAWCHDSEVRNPSTVVGVETGGSLKLIGQAKSVSVRFSERYCL